MADTFRFRTEGDRFERFGGQVYGQSATQLFVTNHHVVAEGDGWDRFLGYWPLRARDKVKQITCPNLTPPVPRIARAGRLMRGEGAC